MKTIYYFLTLLFLLEGSVAFGQRKVRPFEKSLLTKAELPEATQKRLPASARFLNTQFKLADLPASSGELVELEIPVADSTVVLQLAERNLFSDDYQLTDNKGRVLKHADVRTFQGHLKNTTTPAAITFTEDEISGVFQIGKVSFTLGKLKGNNSHVLYKTDELQETKPFTCESIGAQVAASELKNPTKGRVGVGCRIVKIYFEVDNKLYTDWGGTASSVSAKLTSLFNQVASLYNSESVEIVMSATYLWTTADPYVSTANPGEMLSAFATRWNNQGNTFNGNIAHLLSGRPLGGGVAYYLLTAQTPTSVNDLRAVFAFNSKSSAFGVSTSIANTVVSLPTYSWSVNEVARELGHNFGLPHTHSCLWPGGAIDNCGPTAGYPYESGTCTAAPTPTNGGTIMSYCHQVGSVGVNFANGFGPLPRQKMQQEVLNATGLDNSNPPPPVASGVSICSGQTAQLTASQCATYNWFDVSTGGTVLGTAPTFTTPTLTSNKTYYVACVSGSCQSTRTAVNVTVTTPPLPTATGASRCGPGSVTLSASGCTGGTYNWYTPTTGRTVVATTATYPTPVISATTTYYVECRVNNCNSAGVPVVATINPIPAAPQIENTFVKSGTTATLDAKGCTGTVKWYSAANGSLLFTGNPYTTPSLTASNSYLVSCTVGSCESTQATVVVRVCPYDYIVTHSGAISAGTYQAINYINSSANVASGTTYYAGKAIVLTPGFSAGSSETFTAQIRGCNQ